MLSVSRLTKSYGKNLANQDIDFVVEPGEITVLLEMCIRDRMHIRWKFRSRQKI